MIKMMIDLNMFTLESIRVYKTHGYFHITAGRMIKMMIDLNIFTLGHTSIRNTQVVCITVAE